MAGSHRRSNLDPPLRGRNGRKLRVIGVARISTEHQDAKSLDDQRALLARWLQEHTDEPFTLRMIESRGSGERLDRKEFRRLKALVRKERIDLVITEDLGRIVRRIQAHVFCESCEDHGVRLITINDFIDTFKEGWRDLSFFATFRHERYNSDTAKRIRRTLRNRFSQGGVVQTIVYGYIKPPGAKSDDDLRKDPAAEAIYDEWFTRLENGAPYQEIADWLNKLGIPTGPYCRSKTWDCKMVGRVTSNPILKGVRQRNRKISKRVNRTGRAKAVNAPAEERLERHCPHLAFIEPSRYDRVRRLLAERNGKYKPGGDNDDPRAGRPKKRTIWPGQHVYCGICNGLFRYGGHGQNDHLLCRGAYEYRCWNSVTVDGPLASRKLTAAILAEIESLPEFDDELHRLVREELERKSSTRMVRIAALQREEDAVARLIDNIVRFIREGTVSASLGSELNRLERQRADLAAQRQAIADEPVVAMELPAIDDIKRLACESLERQADEPYEFARLMRRLIPRITVWPFRLCDGGPVVLRAYFVLNLAGLLPIAQRHTEVRDHLSTELVVDLFDPPQRAAFRQQVVALRRQGLTEQAVAKQLGITTTAAQRAAMLDRLMQQHGLDDPYVAVNEPPEDLGKMRRHRHPRYRFEPYRDSA